MDSAFRDMIAKGWLVIYMDDILVFAKMEAECQEQTKQVLKWMQEEDLHLMLAKCAFDQTSMEYLGLVVKNGEIHMDPTKLSMVWDWEPPKSVKAVQSFIGFCNFYQKFISNFSTLAWPLHNLNKKEVQFLWTKEQDDAFIKLEEIILLALVIWMPNISKPFHVMTNGSLTASGGVLIQKDANGDLCPCVYHSQMFSPARQNYNIYDRELLAILHALKEWWHYLTRTAHWVTIITDHKNLGYFKQPHHLTCHQAHWMLFLQDYDLMWRVEWGVNMGPVNVLSRKDDINTDDDNHMVTLLPEDDICHQQIHQLELDYRDPWLPHTTKEDWKFEHGSLYFKNCLYIPEEAWHQLVTSIHESPAGGVGGSSELSIYFKRITGGWECPHFLGNSTLDV